MDEKQTRMLVWLAGILLGLVGLLTLVQAPEDNGDDDVTALFAQADAASIQALSITRGDTVLTLERQDDLGWRITAPLQAAADDGRVNRLLEALVAVKAGAPMDTDERAQFGLQPPALVIEASPAQGSSLVLKMGADAPVGGGTYLDTPEGVRVSSGRLSYSLDKSVDDLRDREVLSFSSAAVAAISIATPGEDGAPARTLSLTHDKHGWWIGEPARRVRQATVDDLLQDLQDLRADEFPSGPADLGPGASVITLQTDDTPVVVRLSAPQQGRRLVEGDVQDGAVLCTTTRLDELLARPLEGWLSAHLMPVRGPTIDRLQVTLGSHQLQAVMGEDGWDVPEAASFLSALDEARADRSQALEAQGQPWGAITLAEGDNRSEQVSLYQQVSGGRVAVDAAGGPGFLVPTSELDRLVEALP